MLSTLKFFVVNLFFTWWCPYWILTNVLKGPVHLKVKSGKHRRQRKLTGSKSVYRGKHVNDLRYASRVYWSSCFDSTDSRYRWTRKDTVNGMKEYDKIVGLSITKISKIKEGK